MIKLICAAIMAVFLCTACGNVLNGGMSGKTKDDGRILTEAEKNIEICKGSDIYGKWNKTGSEPGLGIYKFGDGEVEFPGGMLYEYTVDEANAVEIVIVKNKDDVDWIRYEVKKNGENLKISSFDLISGAEDSFEFEPMN